MPILPDERHAVILDRLLGDGRVLAAAGRRHCVPGGTLPALDGLVGPRSRVHRADAA